MSVPLDSLFPPRVKHVLGHGSNTTPSLCHLVAFEAMAYDGRWFARVCLINGGDGSDWVSRPECCVKHPFSCLLMITIFFGYLLHLNMELVSHVTMVIALAHLVSRRDVRVRSNAHNWTSHNEMPCVAAFPAVS